MTPGEAASTFARYAEAGVEGPTVDLARALVDMRAAVHAIHHLIEGGVNDGFCDGCEDTHPCPTWTAVEAVWNGDAS